LKRETTFNFGYGERDMSIPPNKTTVREWKEHATPVPVDPEMVSLGPVWKQVTPNIPHRRGAKWQVRAAAMRVGREMPRVDREWLRAFKQHCHEMLDLLKIRQICPEWIPDFEEWVKHSNYTQARIAELRKLWERSKNWTAADRAQYSEHVKSFIKLETYMMRKWPRGIMSRSDLIKVWIGPVIKQMERLLYFDPLTQTGCKCFIKHVPEGPQRSAHKTELLYAVGRRFGETDFTSFESLTREIQHVCEFSLFRHMAGENVRVKAMIEEFESMCCGTNRMTYKDATVVVRGHRMSGEMTTSIGNGWTNLMLLTFMGRHVHDYSAACPIIIEGDDGLISETPENVKLYAPENFERLGFKIKIDWYDHMSDACFCGVTYDPEDGINVTDPLEELASFGWSLGNSVFAPEKRHKELLIAKAYSLAYQYPGCPIVHELPKMVFRLLGKELDWNRFMELPYFNNWQRGQLANARDMKLEYLLEAKPTYTTRLLVERKFRVSVSRQLQIEKQIAAMTKIGELDIPVDPAWNLDQTVQESRYKKTFPAGTLWSSIRTYVPRYE